MKEFNTTATCIPRMHYMVDISEKLDQIEKMIIGGKYFTINRSRQYGKTTTFAALYRKLKNEYEIIRLSFEGAGSGVRAVSVSFCVRRTWGSGSAEKNTQYRIYGTLPEE